MPQIDLPVLAASYDPSTGHERIEFEVPSNDTYIFTLQAKSGAEPLRAWACRRIGRGWDQARCLGIEVRQDTYRNRLIIALTFDRPWYVDPKVLAAYVQHGAISGSS